MFDQNSVRMRLANLQEWKRLAFGILILERALPNYLIFQVRSSLSGGSVVRAALSKLWGVLEEMPHSDLLNVSSELCQSIAPDTEGHQNIYTSSALDAANISANLIDYIGNKDVELIVDAAVIMHDSVYVFIGNAESTPQSSADFDIVVRSHPLVQGEVRMQDEDLLFLKKITDSCPVGWPLVLQRSIEKPYKYMQI